MDVTTLFMGFSSYQLSVIIKTKLVKPVKIQQAACRLLSMLDMQIGVNEAFNCLFIDPPKSAGLLLIPAF